MSDTMQAASGVQAKRKGKNPVLVVLSVLFGIVLFGLVTAFIVYTGFRRFVSVDSIKEVIGNVEITEMDVSALTGDEDKKLDEYIYEAVDEKMPGVLSQEDIQSVLESDAAKDYIAQMLSGSLDYMLTGEGGFEVVPEDIIGVLEDTGIELTEEDKEQIKTEIGPENLSEAGITPIVDADSVSLGQITFFASSTLFAGQIAAIAVVVALLFLVNIHFVGRAFIDISVPVLLAGLVTLLASQAAGMAQSALNSVGVLPAELVDAVMGQLAGTVQRSSLAALAVGAVLLIAGIVTAVVKKSVSKPAV